MPQRGRSIYIGKYLEDGIGVEKFFLGQGETVVGNCFFGGFYSFAYSHYNHFLEGARCRYSDLDNFSLVSFNFEPSGHKKSALVQNGVFLSGGDGDVDFLSSLVVGEEVDSILFPEDIEGSFYLLFGVGDDDKFCVIVDDEVHLFEEGFIELNLLFLLEFG